MKRLGIMLAKIMMLGIVVMVSDAQAMKRQRSNDSGIEQPEKKQRIEISEGDREQQSGEQEKNEHGAGISNIINFVKSWVPSMKWFCSNDSGNEQPEKIAKIEISQGDNGQQNEQQMLLLSSGGKVVKISRQAAQCSKTLKSMLEDMGYENWLEDKGGMAPDQPIPLDHNISPELLEFVAEFLELIAKGDDKALKRDVNDLLPEYVHEMLLAANYLDCNELLDVCIETYQMFDFSNKKIMDKVHELPEELRELFFRHLPEFSLIKDWLLSVLCLKDTWREDNVDCTSKRYEAHGALLTINFWDEAQEHYWRKDNILSIGQRFLVLKPENKTIEIWHLHDRGGHGYDPEGEDKLVAILNDHNYDIRSIYHTVEWCNKKILAVGYCNKTIKIWNFVDEQWMCVATLSGHDDTVDSVYISSDGKYLASVSADRVVKHWDLEILDWGWGKKFFDHHIMLGQFKLLKLIMQAEKAGGLDLTRNAYLLAVFESLPEGFQSKLIELKLVTME